jgi:hypothetical protein
VSDLDRESADIDPLRVKFNPLGEQWGILDKAAAYFGLHTKWWELTHKGLKMSYFRPSQAIGISVTPAFKFKGQYYLVTYESSSSTGISGINYGGDHDAISRAEEKRFSAGTKIVDGGKIQAEEVDGDQMGLDDTFFEEYIRLRHALTDVEDIGDKQTLEKYVKTEEFLRFAEFFTFTNQLAETIPQDRHIRSFLSIRKVLDRYKRKNSPADELLLEQLAWGIVDYIRIGFEKLYDKHLEEAGYIDLIGELRTLLEDNYQTVLAATRNH